MLCTATPPRFGPLDADGEDQGGSPRTEIALAERTRPPNGSASGSVASALERRSSVRFVPGGSIPDPDEEDDDDRAVDMGHQVWTVGSPRPSRVNSVEAGGSIPARRFDPASLSSWSGGPGSVSVWQSALPAQLKDPQKKM